MAVGTPEVYVRHLCYVPDHPHIDNLESSYVFSCWVGEGYLRPPSSLLSADGRKVCLNLTAILPFHPVHNNVVKSFGCISQTAEVSVSSTKVDPKWNLLRNSAMHFVKSQKLVIRQESRSPPFKLPQEIAEQDTFECVCPKSCPIAYIWFACKFLSTNSNLAAL